MVASSIKGGTVTEQQGKKKINVPAFVNDYTRGASEEELESQYGLDHSQLTRVVGVLRHKGQLTRRDIDTREENLRIRFGDGADTADERSKVSVDLDTGLVLHCPSCGASVKRGAEKCMYCASPLDFSLKGKTIHCSYCYQKTPANSRFCIHCARPIKNAFKDGKVLKDRTCPRCEVAMRERDVGGFSVVGCSECGGLFIEHETFRMMQDASQRIIQVTGKVDRENTDFEVKFSYVRCPVCRTMMTRKNFGRVSGVIVDMCPGHGIWFDPGEMEKIMDFIACGGLQRSRAAQMDELRTERKLHELRSSGSSGGYGSGMISFGDDTFVDYGEVDLFDAVGGLLRTFFR